jgi:hypothetical protein
MTRILLTTALAALGFCACPSSPECSKAADCAELQSTGCDRCPSVATTYCEGGSCVDKPTDTAAVKLNMTTPRSLSMGSIRYAVITFRAADLLPECKNRPNCNAAAAVTCEEVDSEGMDATRFNVAQGGARNTDTQGGTVTSFSDIPLGNVPKTGHLLVVDGHDGLMGQGNRVAHACTSVSPSADTTSVSVVLQPR